MTDVVQKVKTGNINNGSVIVGVNQFGDYDKLAAYNISTSPSGLENKYTDRFMDDDALLPDSQAQWTDLAILPSTFDFAGGTDPSITTWQPAGSGVSFRVWEFEQGDQGFFTAQIPHNYLEGSDIYPHVHWTPKNRGVVESGKTVDWRLDYTIANINRVFQSGVTVVMSDTCTGINDMHEICSSTPRISGTGLTISCMIIGRLYRGTSDTWAGTNAGQLPCLLELDFHYQVNSYGSRQERVK